MWFILGVGLGSVGMSLVSGADTCNQEEILELTVAYIAELQNHLVGRVRTHGEKTFRKLNKNIRIGANLNEKSSKEDIIKFLHKISAK